MQMWASYSIHKDSKELQEAREKLRRAQANGGRDCSPDTRRRMEIATQYKERKAMIERVGMEGYLNSLPVDRSPFPSSPSVPNSLYSFRKVFILNLQRFSSSSKQQANAEGQRKGRRKSKKSRDPARHAAANTVALKRIAATATALQEGQRTWFAAAGHDPEKHLQKKVRFADDLAAITDKDSEPTGQFESSCIFCG